MFLFHFTGVYSPEFEKMCMDFVVHLMDTLELVKKIRFVESLHEADEWKRQEASEYGLGSTLHTYNADNRKLHCKMCPFADLHRNPIKLYD